MAYLPEGSLVWREMGGPAAWSRIEHLAARIDYWGMIGDWRLTKDGHKGRNPPEPPAPPRPVWQLEAEEQAVADAVAERRAERARRDELRAQQDATAPGP